VGKPANLSSRWRTGAEERVLVANNGTPRTVDNGATLADHQHMVWRDRSAENYDVFKSNLQRCRFRNPKPMSGKGPQPIPGGGSNRVGLVYSYDFSLNDRIGCCKLTLTWA